MNATLGETRELRVGIGEKIGMVGDVRCWITDVANKFKQKNTKVNKKGKIRVKLVPEAGDGKLLKLG